MFYWLGLVEGVAIWCCGERGRRFVEGVRFSLEEAYSRIKNLLVVQGT
jgi:hypothetical protein